MVQGYIIHQRNKNQKNIITFLSMKSPFSFPFLLTLFTAEEEGFETYRFSTRCRYFCSVLPSKISDNGFEPPNSLPDCLSSCSLCSLRKRRGSNPRLGFPNAGFRNRCLQPLSHSSLSIYKQNRIPIKLAFF